MVESGKRGGEVKMTGKRRLKREMFQIETQLCVRTIRTRAGGRGWGVIDVRPIRKGHHQRHDGSIHVHPSFVKQTVDEMLVTINHAVTNKTQSSQVKSTDDSFDLRNARQRLQVYRYLRARQLSYR